MKNSAQLSDGSRSQEIAEVKITYKARVKASDRKLIQSSSDAEQAFRTLWDETTIEVRESMVMLLLNRANRAIGFYTLSEGGTAGTVADPKLVFSVALKCLAHGIILCHNHPSGNVKPSQADLDLTKKIKDAGKLLEIQLLDHIIITAESYFSMADEGLI